MNTTQATVKSPLSRTNWMTRGPTHLAQTIGNPIRTMPFRCPTGHIMEEYLGQRLDDFGMSSVKYHLLTCVRCKDLLEMTVREVRKRRAAGESELRAHEDEASHDCLDECEILSTARSDAPGEHEKVLVCESKKLIDRWVSLFVDFQQGWRDEPGWLEAKTKPCSDRQIFVNDLEFAVLDDNSHCRLAFDADGPDADMSQIERSYRGQRKGPAAEKSANHGGFLVRVNRPRVFAFAVQFDDCDGLVSGVASLVNRYRPCQIPMISGVSLAPTGSVVSMVGHKGDLAVPQGQARWFFLQGLIATTGREVQKQIVSDLLRFFREQRAFQWFLGNFGRPYLPTVFRGGPHCLRN